MAGGAMIAPTNSNRPRPSSQPKPTFYVVMLSFLACIGGLNFGYDTGILSSAMLFLPENPGMKPLSTFWRELIVSITPGVGAIGALLGGKSSDYYGRRPVIMVASVIFTIGAIVCGIAPERWTLLVGRILLGLAIGFSSMVIPVYVSEAAPCHLRGPLVSMYQLMIAFGFIVANCIAAIFASVDPVNIGWRLMVAFAGVPAIIQLIGFTFMKDTPRYLFKTGKLEECREVLSRVYGGDQAWVTYNMEEITEASEIEKEYGKGNEDVPVIVRVFRTPHVGRALILGCTIQIFQQLIGVNTIMYYTGEILQSSGIKDKVLTIWITCGMSLVQTLSTIFPVKYIEKMGRRIVTLVSMVGVFFALVAIAISFLVIDKDTAPVSLDSKYDGIGNETDPFFDHCASFSNCGGCVTDVRCGFCHETGNPRVGQCLPIDEASDGELSTIGRCSSSAIYGSGNYTMQKQYCDNHYPYLPIIFMSLYLVVFSLGMGPMPWVLNAEIYPLWARSTCVSLATCIYWIANLAMSLTFLTLCEAITKYGTFFLYAGFTVVGTIIFYFFVPETKGIEIEEVENLFKTRKELDRERAHHHGLGEQGIKKVWEAE